MSGGRGPQAARMVTFVERGFPRLNPKGPRGVGVLRTGGLGKAVVPPHLKAKGVHSGRVLVRTRGIFDIQTRHGRVKDIAARYCHSLHQNEGNVYQLVPASPRPAGRPRARPPSASALARTEEGPVDGEQR